MTSGIIRYRSRFLIIIKLNRIDKERYNMEIKQIGTIHSPFIEASGTPIQPKFAKDANGTVVVNEEYAEGLKDLDGFERIWLIYYFDRVKNAKLTVVPYMDTVEHGVFATRSPARPNKIGMSAVKLEKVEGNTLHVSGIDILDGTPLLDIKPYAKRMDYFDVERQGWLGKVGNHEGKADDRFHK